MKIRNCKRFARFLKWLYVVKDWTNIQNNYIGGNLQESNLIHSNPLNSKHSINNINILIESVNYLQSQELEINKDLLEYINNNDSIINNEEDQNILKYANLYQNIKFYIPCFIDWRGRIYTKYLTYQGGSLSKSLIITSKKREITTDIGLYGFKIYTAMCYGLTSESNDNKLNWFNNNLKSI